MFGKGVTVLLLITVASTGATGEPLTALERQRLTAHLEMTGSWLVSEVAHLSPRQLRFRPSPGVWTIMENLEHMVIAGPIYWQDFQKAMQSPPRAPSRPENDAEILWYGIDRTQRQKALAAEAARNQLTDASAGIGSVQKLHFRILQYIRSSDSDLRAHVVERERCDAFQWLLLISAHEQRHILQIREIKTDPKFPKE
jgi:uncharacterized damage-inducible protein DinB